MVVLKGSERSKMDDDTTCGMTLWAGVRGIKGINWHMGMDDGSAMGGLLEVMG